MNELYIELLKERFEYFKSKSITELTDDEIQEYINLKSEIAEELKDVTEAIKNAWESVLAELSPHINRYRERVLKK